MAESPHADHVFLEISVKTIHFNNPLAIYEDVTEEIVKIGRLLIKLAWKETPITCENFYRIIEGTYGSKLFPSRKLTYKDTMFFNVQKGFFIQGGDVIRNDGTGGETIFGPRIGEESYCLKFEKPYRVAMAGNGRHSVNSQFLITLKEAPVLDNYHCIFGDVVDGFHVLNEIERLISNGLREFQYLYISDCGPNYEGKVHSLKNTH